MTREGRVGHAERLADPQVKYVQAKTIRNLRDHEYGFFYTAEDTCSSLLLLGVPGTFASMYAGRDLMDGRLTLTILPLSVVAAVRTLAQKPVVAEPDPKAVRHDDHSQWFAGNFDNVFSSLTFEMGGTRPKEPPKHRR